MKCKLHNPEAVVYPTVYSKYPYIFSTPPLIEIGVSGSFTAIKYPYLSLRKVEFKNSKVRRP